MQITSTRPDAGLTGIGLHRGGDHRRRPDTLPEQTPYRAGYFSRKTVPHEAGSKWSPLSIAHAIDTPRILPPPLCFTFLATSCTRAVGDP